MGRDELEANPTLKQLRDSGLPGPRPAGVALELGEVSGACWPGAPGLSLSLAM